MRIGLFIPCFVDAFFPEVGVAALELLERLGHEVVYPRASEPRAAEPLERAA
jgi:L-lactate dehydrogenase complex protein LldE